MPVKNQTKKYRTKTNFDTDALNLAVWLTKNFSCLEEQPVDLEPKSHVQKKIQKYLDRHIGRMEENRLHAIIAARDVYRKAHGGRIHLLAGLEGPIVDAIMPQVISEPIDYEAKHKYLVKAVEKASETKAPKVGNIHFHLFRCRLSTVLPATLLQFLRTEHGYQNELHQISDFRFYLFNEVKPCWVPNVNAEMINNLFSNR